MCITFKSEEIWTVRSLRPGSASWEKGGKNRRWRKKRSASETSWGGERVAQEDCSKSNSKEKEVQSFVLCVDQPIDKRKTKRL